RLCGFGRRPHGSGCRRRADRSASISGQAFKGSNVGFDGRAKLNLRYGAELRGQKSPIEMSDQRVGPGTMETFPQGLIGPGRMEVIAQRHERLLASYCT